MRGIVCEEIERFRYADDLPEPVPTPGHAVVTVRRIGVCGTDLHAFKGKQPFFAYPRILGHELAGVIAQIGPNDEGLRVGDQVSVIPYLHCGRCIACRGGKTNCCTDMQVMGVHIDGGMRERISVPVTHLIQTNALSLDQTATLEPFAIGAHAVRRSGLQAGETALVIGGGPIGLGVMAFAKASGAKVIAMDVNEGRLAFCRDWARADETANALQDPLSHILAANGGELPSVVFDATGNTQSMTDAFGYVAHAGRLVYVGLVRSDIRFHDPEFHKRELTLLGSRNATREDFDRVLEVMASGDIDVDRYVTHRSSLSDTIANFEEWLKPETKVIKAMIEL